MKTQSLKLKLNKLSVFYMKTNCLKRESSTISRRRSQITVSRAKLRNPTYKIVDANWNVSVLPADADVELEE